MVGVNNSQPELLAEYTRNIFAAEPLPALDPADIVTFQALLAQARYRPDKTVLENAFHEGVEAPTALGLFARATGRSELLMDWYLNQGALVGPRIEIDPYSGESYQAPGGTIYIEEDVTTGGLSQWLTILRRPEDS